MFLLLRVGCATLSACIVRFYFQYPAVGALWMILWAFVETLSFRRSSHPLPRLLRHLRYGPIVTLLFFVVAIAVSDLMLIEYSRWEIVRYIHSDAPVTEEPSFKLHNNYRSWCGNGMAAHRYYLYGDTPAAYIDDADAATRARALQASMKVYDWINHPNDGPSIDALKKAATDPDPMVREMAAKFRAELHY